MKKKVVLLIFGILCFNVFAGTFYDDFEMDEISVSSYLKEKNTSYGKECLSAYDELPWVPEGSDNGKNQTIILDDVAIDTIYISIGYVSKERPDLYYKNSRPKSVQVYYSETNESVIYELEDTPEPQPIMIFDRGVHVKGKNKVILSFPEVYEGTQYKDLCINYLCKEIFETIDETIYEDKKLTYTFQYALRYDCYIENKWGIAEGIYLPGKVRQNYPGFWIKDSTVGFIVSKKYIVGITVRVWDMNTAIIDFNDDYTRSTSKEALAKTNYTIDDLNDNDILFYRKEKYGAQYHYIGFHNKQIIYKYVDEDSAENPPKEETYYVEPRATVSFEVIPELKNPTYIVANDVSIYKNADLKSEVIGRTEGYRYSFTEQDGSKVYMIDMPSVKDSFLEIIGQKYLENEKTVMLNVKGKKITGWINNSDLTLFYKYFNDVDEFIKEKEREYEK